MSMYFDPHGNIIADTEAPLKEELEAFVRQMVAWEKAGCQLYPSDVVNMLVELKVMPSFNVKKAFEKPIPAAIIPTQWVDINDRLKK